MSAARQANMKVKKGAARSGMRKWIASTVRKAAIQGGFKWRDPAQIGKAVVVRIAINVINA